MSTTTKLKSLVLRDHEVRALATTGRVHLWRAVWPQPPAGCHYTINGAGSHALCFADDPPPGTPRPWCVPPTPTSEDHRLPCPLGRVGEVRIVREAFRRSSMPSSFGIVRAIEYRCDGAKLEKARERVLSLPSGIGGGWRPATRMPLWAARHAVRIGAVRVARVREITEEEARAAGVDVSHRATVVGEERRPCVNCGQHRDSHVGATRVCWGTSDVYSTLTYRGGFAVLWDATDGRKPGCDWASNPLCWAADAVRVDRGEG